MIILNLILGIAEAVMLPACLYYFMKNNTRTIYRPRWMTFLCLVVYAMGMLLITVNAGSQIIVCLTGIGLTFITGVACFHTSVQSLFWDAVYQVVIYLCQISVIYGMIAVLQVQSSTDVYIRANLSIGIKLLMEFLVTLVMVRMIEGKKRASLRWKQLLCMFLLPVISLILMLSLVEIGSLYFKLYGIGLVAFDMVLLIFLNIYFIYLLGYLFRTKNLEDDLKVFQIQNRLQLTHYEDLDQK